MKTIVAIGDSLTYGFPFSPRASWVNLTARQIGAPIINKGICGETTGDMLLRFEQDVIAPAPVYTVIMGGTNDAFMDIDPQEVAENFAAMLDLAGTNGVVPLIGLPPPVDFPAEEALLEEYRQQMRRLVRLHSITVLDFYAAMVAPGGGLRKGLHDDGVHPNEAGYKVMAEVACAVLKNLL
jgi:acyl-CoA thioesterase I